jgi:hypothetical protein
MAIVPRLPSAPTATAAPVLEPLAGDAPELGQRHGGRAELARRTRAWRRAVGLASF